MRYTQIEIPLAGVDQFSDAPYVLKGQKLDTAENLRMRSPPKLSARYPMADYSLSTLDSSTIGVPRQILGHGKETLLANETTLYSYDSVGAKWGNKGTLSECLVSRFPCVANYAVDMKDGDCIYNQGITVVCWTTSTSAVNSLVIDEATGAILATQALSAAQPKLVSVGNSVYMLYQSGGTIVGYTIDVTSTNYTWASATCTPTAAVTASPSFDVCPWSSTEYLIAYYSSGGTKVYVDKITAATGAVAATQNHTRTACNAIGLCKTSSTLGYVASSGTGGPGSGLYLYAFNSSLVSSAGSPIQLSATATVPRVGLVNTGSARTIAVWEEPAAGAYRNFTKWNDFESTPTAGTSRTLYDVVPVTKPVCYNSRTYVLTVNNSDWTRTATASNARQESTYYLVECASLTATTAPRLVSYAARGFAKPTVYAGYLSGWGVNGTKHDTATAILAKFKYAKEDDEDALISRAHIARTRFDFDPTNLHSSCGWAHGRFFAGGRPSWYDGNRVTEHGFPWGPDWESASVAVTGGNTLTDGTYIVASTYEHEDAGGYITRSLPSPFYDLTLTVGNETITITHDHQCDLTARSATTTGAVRVVHWKTAIQASAGTGNEPLYQGATGDPEEFGGFAVDVGTACVLDMPDANAISEPVLYTTGDILDNGPTPPCKVAVRHGDRIFLAGLEDPELVAFSQPFVTGEQPRFNEALTLRFPEDVTALGSMDSSLVVFCKSSIFVVSGEGPPATGGLDIGFGVTGISRVIGTTQPRSVLTTPKGVLFLSDRGLYLLDRGFALNWVGAAVIDTTTSYPVCTGSAVDPQHPEAVFWLRNTGDTGSGYRAIWNYELDQWFTDVMPSYPAEVGTTYTRGTCGGVAWKQSLSAYTLVQGLSDTTVSYDKQSYPPVERSDYINTQLITGWIPLNTIQGWQRVRKLLVLLDMANVTSGVTLAVQVGYDYDPAWFEAHTFTGTELEALGSPAYAYLTIALALIADGDTVAIWDGSVTTTFEFDNNATVVGTNTPITFTGLETVTAMRDLIVAAINGATLGVTASVVGQKRIRLQNNTPGAAGNGACTSSAAGVVIDNMSYGVDADQVEVHLARQECQAVRFRLRVTGTADDAGNIDYRSLVIDAGVQPRTMQLNADNARD